MSFPKLSAHPGPALIVFILALFASVSSGAVEAKYPARINDARSTWIRDSKRISELLEKLRDHATTCNRLDQDVRRSEGDLQRVEDELAEQLREMAEGRFCSECLRSASELERTVEPFLYHVRKVNGTAIPASPEQIAQARQRAAEKIASIRTRLKQQRDEKQKALNALNDALHQLNVTMAAYHHDIVAEKDLQIASWGAEARDLEEKLTDLQAQIEALANQGSGPARDVQIRAAEAQMRSSLAAASTAEARARQTANGFRSAVRKDMDYLAKKAEAIPSGQPLVDGWQIARRIVSQTITYVPGPVRRPQSSGAAQLLKSGSKSGDSSSPTRGEKPVSDLLKGK